MVTIGSHPAAAEWSTDHPDAITLMPPTKKRAGIQSDECELKRSEPL
jgi:hypothetical protein